ncbi:MAG: hypothetical protein Q8M92_09305 [Candidatus Subteraquimicrobiales bacterium]|nr:hypothetical protein [Candidatus Subteraquimicrobiales bacterium]
MGDKLIESFIERFDDFSKWNGKKQVDYLAYFLMTEMAVDSFTAKQIHECFDLLSLKHYTRLAVYLSENAISRNGRYIKSKTGYCLERSVYNSIKQEVNNEPKKVQVSQDLANLAVKIKNPQEKVFLQEAINCYKVESYRATIIMGWILAVDHLQKYIFDKKLTDFNNELAKNPDKRIKKIINYDDFSDLHEVKFIELSRAANIITNDVRKILDEKLGIRNSAAHPSGIIFTGHKTTEFALDIINNILLKY